MHTLDGYDIFHRMGIISACLCDGNFAAVNPKLPPLKCWMTAKNLCSGEGIRIRVRCTENSKVQVSMLPIN